MSNVSNGDAASAVGRLIWVSRQLMASPGDDERWRRFQEAVATAKTSALNNSVFGPCLKQIRELEAWATYRRTGNLEPGMGKDWATRVGQLHSQLGGCASAISQ